ncbi:hypothetical protein KFL_005060100, partial [Klebsormidium nitens]
MIIMERRKHGAVPPSATWHSLIAAIGLVGLLFVRQAEGGVSGQPMCDYQPGAGMGNTFILSRMSVPFAKDDSLGEFYVDEGRRLMFTTWNNGVYMFPLSLDGSYLPTFLCPQKKLQTLNYANGNLMLIPLALDTSRGILFAPSETGGSSSKPIWYAIEYTVSPVRITTMTHTSGTFAGTGAGAPRSLDYDSVKKRLITAVKGAPIILLDVTSLSTTPGTTVVGMTPGTNGLQGLDWTGAGLDVTNRWGHFVGQQYQASSSTWNMGVSTKVNLDNIHLSSAWTTPSYFSNLNKAYYYRFQVGVIPNSSVYWTGRHTDTTSFTISAGGMKSLGWLMRRDYSSVTASWQLTGVTDKINGFGLDPATQQVYMGTSQQLNTTYLVPYSRIYNTDTDSQWRMNAKYGPFSRDQVNGNYGQLIGSLWFSNQTDIGIAWHSSISNPGGVDLVAFRRYSCWNASTPCASISGGYCSCRVPNTPYLLSYYQPVQLYSCIGGAQANNTANPPAYPTCEWTPFHP